MQREIFLFVIIFNHTVGQFCVWVLFFSCSCKHSSSIVSITDHGHAQMLWILVRRIKKSEICNTMSFDECFFLISHRLMISHTNSNGMNGSNQMHSTKQSQKNCVVENRKWRIFFPVVENKKGMYAPRMLLRLLLSYHVALSVTYKWLSFIIATIHFSVYFFHPDLFFSLVPCQFCVQCFSWRDLVASEYSISKKQCTIDVCVCAVTSRLKIAVFFHSLIWVRSISLF